MDHIDINHEIGSRQQNIKMHHYKMGIVIGVGGIGSWVALNLALSGKVDYLYIIDPDIVEASNLNRTPFRICDIGKPKVDAMKYIILERRAMPVVTFRQKTDEALCLSMKEKIAKVAYSGGTRIQESAGFVVDCRDDIYNDFYSLNLKYYKLGYDGLSATVDGNPRNTPVWGRANGYAFTPSFVCPAQLVANLVVTDLLTVKNEEDEEDTTENTNAYDNRGRINKAFTFDCSNVMETLYRESIAGETR